MFISIINCSYLTAHKGLKQRKKSKAYKANEDVNVAMPMAFLRSYEGLPSLKSVFNGKCQGQVLSGLKPEMSNFGSIQLSVTKS